MTIDINPWLAAVITVLVVWYTLSVTRRRYDA